MEGPNDTTESAVGAEAEAPAAAPAAPAAMAQDEPPTDSAPAAAAVPAAAAAAAADGEKRYDPNCPQGKNYTREQFIKAYGDERGPAHWDACLNALPGKKRPAPAPAAPAEPRRGGRARKKASLGDDYVSEPDRASMNTKIR